MSLRTLSALATAFTMAVAGSVAAAAASTAPAAPRATPGTTAQAGAIGQAGAAGLKEVMFVGNNWDGTADVIASRGDFARIGRVNVIPDKDQRLAEISQPGQAHLLPRHPQRPR